MSPPSSRGGWSEPEAPREPSGEPAEHPFAAAELDRYRSLELVGAGGMGEVHSAWDVRLGREVALKRVSAVEGDALALRLAREAWITARLEHPGIVPVYDAGRGADGRLFYAMRLVRGRSFGEVLAEAGTLEQRLALLRQFLATCHAVAFAHRQGVVHRDLKPANFMLGQFGETVVVDWGLAVVLDAAERHAAMEHDPAPNLGASAHGIGTPAYMAPEQARGEPPTRAIDVWALGAILFELLAGRPLLTARTVAEAAAATPELSALKDPSVPPELAAIASKALRADPRARYADAHQLADDLAAWLDGRRVTAHAYSTLELLRRLVMAWRWPLRAAVLGLLAAGVATAVTWRRVVAERERAVQAEARTRSALEVERASAARALVSRAVLAQDTQASAVAEVLAARALANGESADARGVLAATAASARPFAGTQHDTPGCVRWVDVRGDTQLCVRSQGGGARFEGRASSPRWQNDEPWSDAALVAGDDVAVLRAPRGLLLLDGRDGRVLVNGEDAVAAKGLHLNDDGTLAGAFTPSGDVLILDVAARATSRHRRPCGGAEVTAFTLTGTSTGGTLVAACSDERVVVRSLDGVELQSALVRSGAPHKGVMALSVQPGGRAVALGGVDGTLWILELATGAVYETALAAEPLVRLRWQGDLLAVSFDRGGAALWSLEQRRTLFLLPVGTVARSSRPGHVVGLGHAQWDWELPERFPPNRFTAPAGLSQVAVSPDGAWLAGAGGDGAITIWSRATGAVVTRLTGLGGVVKRVAFSFDGRRLAAAAATTAGGVHVFDTRDWSPLAWDRGRPSRRVLFLRNGSLVALPYGDGFDLWDPTGRRAEVKAAPRVVDAALGGGDNLWLLTEDERVVTWDGSSFTPRYAAPGASAISVSADETTVATARLDAVVIHRGEAARAAAATLPARSGDLVELTVTPDGRWVVAGTRSGTSEVWDARSGRYVAALRGHGQRNGAATVAPDGQLLTTSWDGTVRAWDLGVLTRTPDEVLQLAAHTWALPVDEALGASTR